MNCSACLMDCTDHYISLSNDRRPECPTCHGKRERLERKAEQRKAEKVYASIEAEYRKWLHA